MEEFKEKTQDQRVRINISLTAKGLVQWDITSEQKTAVESIAELNKALDLVKSTISEKGYKEAGN